MTHRTGPLSDREQRCLRYSQVCRQLKARYIDARGLLVVSVGGRPTRYAWLEALACVKYLGCDPCKLGVPGLENARIRRPAQR